MTDLDTRGRAAAAALRDSLANAPVPELEVRRPSRAPWMLAAAAITVVVGLVAAMAVLAGDGGDGANVATEGPVEVPRLILDPVPAGLEPTGRVELPMGSDVGSRIVHSWLYGDPSDPLGEPNVGILLIPDGGDVLGLRGEDDFEIEGHPAQIQRGHEREAGMLTVIVDLGVDGLLSVRSQTLDRNELVEIAEQVIDDDPESMPATLGEGLEPVSEIRGADYAVLPIMLPSASGFGVGYQREGASDSAVVVSVKADEDDLLLARWSLGRTAEPVEVRGADGWIASPFGSGHIVLWEEEPGVLVGLMSSGGKAETIARAESLRPATDAEWEALPPPNLESDGETTFEGEGEVIDAPTTTMVETSNVPKDTTAHLQGAESSIAWTAYVLGDGSLCYETKALDDAGSVGDGGCVGESGGLPSSLVVTVSSDGPVVVFALAGTGVPSDATAALFGCGSMSSEVPMQTDPISDGGLLAAGSCPDPDDRPVGVVVSDRLSGEVLARESIE